MYMHIRTMYVHVHTCTCTCTCMHMSQIFHSSPKPSMIHTIKNCFFSNTQNNVHQSNFVITYIHDVYIFLILHIYMYTCIVVDMVICKVVAGATISLVTH